MKLYRLIPGLLLLLIPVMALAAGSGQFRENVSYERIVPAQPTAERDKVEVIEVFWYGCPHCHRFQPYVDRWLLGADTDITFIRLPAILNENWAVHARAYYTAEALGVTEEIHEPLFDAIHNKKERLRTEDELAEFFDRHGVDRERFHKTFNSFAINSKVQRARELTRRYGIEGTPAVVINGKYRTGPGMTGSFERVIDVMDHLVDEELTSLNNL
jgi:protein dithiol oxidoreductase (disulfide-forming)